MAWWSNPVPPSKVSTSHRTPCCIKDSRSALEGVNNLADHYRVTNSESKCVKMVLLPVAGGPTQQHIPVFGSAASSPAFQTVFLAAQSSTTSSNTSRWVPVEVTKSCISTLCGSIFRSPRNNLPNSCLNPRTFETKLFRTVLEMHSR